MAGGGADLGTTVIETPDLVTVGQDVTKRVTVRNRGPEPATDVVVTDTLPNDVTFRSATPSQGTCRFDNRTVTCRLGTIASGATATIDIVVTPTVVGTLTNRVTVTSDVADPHHADNTASVTFHVGPRSGAGGTGAANDNDDDKKEQRRDERREDIAQEQEEQEEEETEGHVVGVRCQLGAPIPTPALGEVPFNPADVPYALIVTVDGVQQVRLVREARAICGVIQVGDYLEANGDKVHEFLFDAESFVLLRGGVRVR